MPVSPEQESQYCGNAKKEQGMTECPPGSNNIGKQQGKRFVKKIGKDRAQDTERKCAPVTCQVPESKTKKGTKKNMGKDKHSSPGGYCFEKIHHIQHKKNIKKRLQETLLVSGSAFHGFLQDLDVGNVMLAQ